MSIDLHPMGPTLNPMNPIKYLELAAQVSRLKDDDRTYFLGAVGIRKDGVIVCAANGNPKEPEPEHHAEARLLRKLGKCGIVFVARTLADGTWAMARPCVHCRIRLYNFETQRIYYTVRPGVHHSFCCISKPAGVSMG